MKVLVQVEVRTSMKEVVVNHCNLVVPRRYDLHLQKQVGCTEPRVHPSRARQSGISESQIESTRSCRLIEFLLQTEEMLKSVVLLVEDEATTVVTELRVQSGACDEHPSSEPG